MNYTKEIILKTCFRFESPQKVGTHVSRRFDASDGNYMTMVQVSHMLVYFDGILVHLVETTITIRNN
jgi:hypothetical protein